MPFSDASAHVYLAEAIRARIEPGDAPTVLDCGTGCGMTAKVAKGVCPEARITGLEIFAPYVVDDAQREMQRSKWGLHHHLYESMVIGQLADFRSYLLEAEYRFVRGIRGVPHKPQRFDFVIFGDSLEHVTEEEAVEAMVSAKRVARVAVIVCLPLEYIDGEGFRHWVPQGEVYGNPHEAHLKHWKREELEDLGLVHAGDGEIASVFVYDCQKELARL